MSITGIGSYQSTAGIQLSGQTQAASAAASDGDADRSRVTAPTTATGKSGLFTAAISQTLFQIGVTPAAANVATGAAPANPQQQALTSFVQNLFGALQAPGGGAANAAGGKSTSSTKANRSGGTTANNANATEASATYSASSAGSPIAELSSNLEGRLQGLMQQVGDGNPSSGTDANDPALPALQQSYQNLLSTQGVSGSPVSLTNFLQVLSQNLQDVPLTGNLISTSA